MIVVHADRKDARVELGHLGVDPGVADLAADLDRGLRWARSIFDAIMADPKVWRYLDRTDYGAMIEIFVEDEQNQTELCWAWEELEGDK